MQGWCLSFCLVLLCLSACRGLKLQTSANVTDLVRNNGYPVQVHQAITDDGYILTLHRIPHGRQNSKATQGPVLLQHGLTDASAGWCLNPPLSSLAYILADAGYDVWLGNNRGNGYSMASTHHSPNEPAFWDFSWDEMAIYDFPANIKYVLQASNAAKLSYIGHSEGTIQAFAGLINQPSLANSLNAFVALAPVAYTGQITVQLLQILAHLDADKILQLLGNRELYLMDVLHTLLPEVCRANPPTCQYGGTIFYGKDTYLNQSMLSVYTNYEPFPTSVKNIIHWAQGVRTATFAKFDYGTQGNLQHYGQPTPPPYNLSQYPKNLPTIFFTGGIDGLADPQDVERLLRELPIKPTVYSRSDYGHLDPLLGDASYRLTYPTLLAELAKYKN